MTKCITTNKETITKLKNELIEDSLVFDMANIFSAISDSTRTKILYLLAQTELCVCDLQEIIGMSQSSISHHLRLLKNLKIVKFHKKGKHVFYSLKDQHIKDLLVICEEHIKEEK